MLHDPASSFLTDLALTNGRAMLSTPWLDLYHLCYWYACAYRSGLPTQGLWIIYTWVTAGELKFYRLFGTRCHVGTWFGEAKQVRSNSLSVCVCTYAWEQERDKELAQTLLCAVWVSWGSSKYQETGQKHDLIFSFLSFIQSHGLFSLTHKVWTAEADGTHHIKPISRLWVDVKW